MYCVLKLEIFVHVYKMQIYAYKILCFSLLRDDPFERMWTFMKLNEEVSLLPERAVGVRSVLERENYIYLDDAVINNYMAQVSM